MVYTVTITAEVTPEQVVEEMSIEPDDWAKLDEETRWMVLRKPEAVEAALRIVYRKEDRPGDGFGGLAHRVMNIAEDHDSDDPMPPKMAALHEADPYGAYWSRHRKLMRAADRFLDPALAGVR